MQTTMKDFHFIFRDLNDRTNTQKSQRNCWHGRHPVKRVNIVFLKINVYIFNHCQDKTLEKLSTLFKNQTFCLQFAEIPTFKMLSSICIYHKSLNWGNFLSLNST